MKQNIYSITARLLGFFLLLFGQPAAAQYCSGSFLNLCTSNDFINNITLNSLSNNGTGCNGNTNNYIEYLPTGTLTTTLESGSSYTISLQSGIQWPQGFGVWIDLNNDLDFDDPDEFLYASPTASINLFTGPVTIPSNPDYIGARRMRVRCKYNSTILPTESCASFNYGETEDYTVTIAPATSSMEYVSSTVVQSNSDALSLGQQDAEMIGIQVNTIGGLNPIDLTSLTINDNGSTNFANDVDAVKVYYTGNSPVFNTDQLYAIATNLSAPIVVNATLSSGANYFWVTYDISPGAQLGDTLDAACTQLVMTGAAGTQVPTVTSPDGYRVVNYCYPIYENLCTSNDFIDNVTLNTLSNLSSGCNGNTNNYIYYPPAGNFTTSLELGGNYTVSLQAGQEFNQGFGVWIDFNNDLDFADADEFVYASPAPGTEIFLGNISIPNNIAYLGDHRMRIRCIYNYVPLASDYCSSQFYGETEDYTITITPSTTMTFVSTSTYQNNTLDVLTGAADQDIISVEVVTSGSISPFNLTSLTVNSNGSTDFANDVSNVKVYFTGADPGFSTDVLFGLSTNLGSPVTGNATLISGINHFWVTYDITADAGIGDYLDAECTQVVMTGAGGIHVPAVTAPAGNRQVGYCQATSIYGCGFYFIDAVSINTLSNVSSGCNGAADGYIKYPAAGNNTTTLELGNPYLLSLEGPEFASVGFGVWIDYNNDGDFEDADEFVYASSFATTGPQGGEITVPDNAAYVGERRMRVREKEYANVFDYESCAQFYFGETEDYTITISSPTNMTYQSSTTYQNNLNDVVIGETDAEMMLIQVVTQGTLNPIDLFSITLSSAGSTNFPADVTGVKVYATGQSPVFSTGNLFGSATNLSSPVSGAQTLNTGNNYFWVTYDVAPAATLGDYLDVSCNQLQLTGAAGTQVPAVTSPDGSRQVGYCTAASLYGCQYYFIDGVTLNTLSNLTGCNGASNGYIKYPATGSNTTSLEVGSSYTITLEGPLYNPVGFGVWIDFNNDGDFDDADEFVFASPTYETGTQSGLIFIPANNAYLGERRMRIRAEDYAVIGSTEACTTYYSGETEDYTITLVPASTMVFSSVTTFQNNLSAVQLNMQDAEIAGVNILTIGSLNPYSLNSITFNANGSTDFANDVTGVKVYYSGSNPDFSTAELFGSASSLSSPITGSVALAGGANYFWLAYDIAATGTIGHFVDAECVSITLSGTGGTHVPDITAPAGSREINYCVGTYTYQCTSDDYIDNFTFNTLSNLASGCNGNVDNYINYNPTGNLTTTVMIGGTYDLTVQSGPDWMEGFGIWIDYNNDASFDGADEFVYASPDYGTSVYTGTVTIPLTASYVGQHRLRVRCNYYDTVAAEEYCSLFSYGETEDYTITIEPLPPCTGVPEPGTLSVTPDEFCAAGTVASLTLSNYPLAADIAFQWEQSANGTLWNTISGATGYTYATPPLSATSYYRVKVTCNNSGGSSYTNAAVINMVAAPAAPVAADVTHCGPGTVLLSASGGSGVLRWYDQLTGGTLLGTGASFTTPYITATTTYYVEEYIGTDITGCSSLRTPVKAIIYHPAIAASVDLDSICAGGSVNLQAENNGSGTFNYQWTPLIAGMIPANGQGASVIAPPAANTVFTVTASEVNGQCDTSLSVGVIVSPLPVVQLTGLSNTYEVIAPAVTLSGTPAGGNFSGPGVTGNSFSPAAAGVGGPYVISYTYSDANACTGVDTVHVVVTFPIGIDQPLTAERIIIYPNPGDGLLVLDITAPHITGELDCKVFNIVGQVVHEETIHVNGERVTQSFDFRQWSKGTYYFELRNDDQVIRKKIVIQ
ncbi:MAG: T9SS type A sorting domain-containing protein [Chitinophagales bacterium]|nr:T9SS type A sorting domain-containing protein [Chitinophagales bacterium]